jgi:penicillin-binding protein 1A
MGKRRTRRKRRSRFARYFRRLVITALLATSAGAVAAGAILYWEINASLPNLSGIVEYRPPVTTQVLADDGTLIAEFFSEKRYLVPIERIPPHVREAFIAAEDDAFYQHKGVDPISIGRALLNNLVAGGRTQGGSTITQQVVKSVLLTPEKSYERKIKEVLLALRLEKQLSKDEILTLYLNHIYLGSGAYGVAAAAREYFGKDVADINLAEAALLAGLPQAPSRYSPFRRWPRAKARQQYVLNRMYDAGFITREQYDDALHQPIALASQKGSFIAAPYFVEHVRRMLEERYGHTALYELGLRVRTTVNVELQRTAEAALRKGLEELSTRHEGYRSSFRWMDETERSIYLEQQRQAVRAGLDPSQGYEAIVTSVRRNGARVRVGRFEGELLDPSSNGSAPPLQVDDLIRVRPVRSAGPNLTFVYDDTPPVEGAAVVVDPRAGYVKAMVGGYEFDRSEFNRVTQARRQPGSAFKPFVYAAALERYFTPASVIIDEPVYFQDNDRIWSPKNFENEHFGPTTLREALVKSRNVVTVKLADRIGVKYLVSYLQRFGFPRPFAPNLSIALGSSEVTPLELATAYCAFATGGVRPEPIFITEITDSQGRVIEANRPRVFEAIPPQTAYLITSILRDVVERGTGQRARGLGRPTAGKTGTTNETHDAWFAGFTPQTLAVVWVGFDNKRTLGRRETGGRVAAPIWKTIMEEATHDLPVEDFVVPEGVKCVHIDPVSGMRAVAGEGAALECFREGSEPQLGEAPAVQPAGGDRPSRPSALDFLRGDF